MDFLAYHEDVCSDGPVRKQQCLPNKDADLFIERKTTMRGHKGRDTGPSLWGQRVLEVRLQL